MTELVFILDRSGSMSGLETDTIGGFNSMLARQKKEAGEAVVSTALNYEVIGEAVCSVRAARPLSADWKRRIDEDVHRRGR